MNWKKLISTWESENSKPVKNHETVGNRLLAEIWFWLTGRSCRPGIWACHEHHFDHSFLIRFLQQCVLCDNSLCTFLLLIKAVFASKVQKPGKLATTGIGIYFLSWLMFWAL